MKRLALAFVLLATFAGGPPVAQHQELEPEHKTWHEDHGIPVEDHYEGDDELDWTLIVVATLSAIGVTSAPLFGYLGLRYRRKHPGEPISGAFRFRRDDQ